MPIVLPTCAEFPLLLDVPCVRLPGGAQMCFQVPGVAPATPFEVGTAALAGVNSALAPLAPFFDVLGVVQQITATIKAVATLNPEEIAEAIPALIEKVAALAPLIPALSIPVFIIDLLKLIALVLDGLADELDAVASYADALSVARNVADSGVEGARAAVECADGHVLLMLAHLGGQLGPINQLIGLLNGFLQLAGLEKFAIPCIQALDPGALTQFTDVLRGVASFLRLLSGQLPQPGKVGSRVVPCP